MHEGERYESDGGDGMNVDPPPFPRDQDLSHAEMRLIRERDKEWMRALREHVIPEGVITDAMHERAWKQFGASLNKGRYLHFAIHDAVDAVLSGDDYA